MSFTLACLIVAFAAEALRLATWRYGRESRLGRIAAPLTWLMRPIAAACAVNVVFRLCGFRFSNAVTYPLYANEWWPKDWTAAMRLKAIFSSEGIIPWLPLAAFLVVVASCAAYCVARFAKCPPPEGRGRFVRWMIAIASPVLVAAFCFSFMVSVNCLPRGLFTGEGQRASFLANWHTSGSTMLYAIPRMQPNVKAYWKNYHEIQLRLNKVIHAKSHPPVASSFVRWIGKLFGVDVGNPMSYRDAHARLRYALGQTFFSSLNVFLVFLIGLAMFDWRTGLLASIIWAVAPSVCSYGVFAPDMNYALFFHGAILFTWLVATERQLSRSLLWGVPLGLCFAMLVLMTFSWCIMTAISAAFILVAGAQSRRPVREMALRAALPLAVMVLAAGYAIVHYQIHYFTIYKTASAFVARFYHKQSFWQKAMAFAGGQAEWLSLMGPLTCSGFFLWLLCAGKDAATDRHVAASPQRLYALTLLGVFLIPILFGPACLKHEVARCWIWMAAVPVVLSARFWLTRGSPAMCVAVTASSAILAVTLRLFVRFLA